MKSLANWLPLCSPRILLLVLISSFSGPWLAEARSDLLIDHSGIAGTSWAINPNNVVGVRFQNTGSAFQFEGAHVFVGTNSPLPITADVSVVEFDSMTDLTGTVLGTINNVIITSPFPTDFNSDALFIDVSSLGITISENGFYGVVVTNPSSGFLIGAVDNSDPVANNQSITSGTFPDALSGPAGQDMAFQAHGTVVVPEPALTMIAILGLMVFSLYRRPLRRPVPVRIRRD